jgi:hypothetical protein
VTVTLASAAGAVLAVVPAAAASAGAGDVCDAACYDAGFLAGVGTSSCCAAPSCPMGCAIGSAVGSLAACNAQCRNATGCAYNVPGTALELSMCDACIDGCPGKGDCEAGCALRFAAPAPVAWKALLPSQAAGTAAVLTAACANCAAGAAAATTLAGVVFGSVFYCSGQSNAALGAQYTYAYDDVVAEVGAGALDAIRFFQFGGMSAQNAASSPVYATTALTYPTWPWQNLSAALAVGSGFSSLKNVPATCLYFVRALVKEGFPGPIGFIANAVGGTTLAAWADASVLDACPNSTDTASAAPPTVLFNGMAAPLFNTSITGWVYYQGENDCGGVMGNSEAGYGYGCALPKLVARYRAAWSVEPGTTPADAPFGIVTLAANTNEGSGQRVAGMRWSQTGNVGVLQNPIMPRTFLAQLFDMGDPWEMYDADGKNCSKMHNGAYGKSCVVPWTDLGTWDAAMRPLAAAIRNDSTPSFMGGIHPRIKPPVGARLAVAYMALFGGSPAPFTGPTVAGCAVAGGTLTVAYNATLLRGEAVLVQPFDADQSHWGVRDSASFMVCFSAAPGGADCLASDEQHLGLWVAAPAVAGADGASAVLTLPPPPPSGGVLAAVRYGWPLSNEGDTCCPNTNVTRGLQVCVPANCPVKLAATLLPGNPFYANITASGKCRCLRPQVCDA